MTEFEELLSDLFAGENVDITFIDENGNEYSPYDDETIYDRMRRKKRNLERFQKKIGWED